MQETKASAGFGMIGGRLTGIDHGLGSGEGGEPELSWGTEALKGSRLAPIGAGLSSEADLGSIGIPTGRRPLYLYDLSFMATPHLHPNSRPTA